MIFGEKKVSAYDHIDAKSNQEKNNGKQGGDPSKGGQAMYKLALEQDPPARIVLGSDAYGQIIKVKVVLASALLLMPDL